jgi:hypothetical protein
MKDKAELSVPMQLLDHWQASVLDEYPHDAVATSNIPDGPPAQEELHAQL